MKVANIKFSAFAYDEENNILGHRFFCTEDAMSKWANKWYLKSEEITVDVYDFNTDNLYCRYHA